jgi:hypothetical protein
MRKDTIVFMCSPDTRRMNARRAIGSVKATDLSRAEFYLIDNGNDPRFNHSAVMNDMLRHAERTNRNLVILDDDVEIHEYGWLNRLYAAADDLDADIVGCVHTDDGGEVNHMGIVVGRDGLTESLFDFRHDPSWVRNHATYVPTLCSAIMLMREPSRYVVDASYKKYFQDMDVCMQAWSQDRRVGIALDLRLIHIGGATGNRNPQAARFLGEDLHRFNTRWQSHLDRLYARPELQQYDRIARSAGWIHEFMRAARLRYVDPAAARAIYERIVAESYAPEYVAGSHFHLHALTGDINHLIRCNHVNPCHQAARTQLEAAGVAVSRRCMNGIDCRGCHFGPQAAARPASRTA